MRPARGDAIAVEARKGERGKDDQEVKRGDDELQERVERRAQHDRNPVHCVRASTAAERSANIFVFSGRPPSALVFFPLPVSTSTGSAPTAAAHCKSRKASPTAGTPFKSRPKRSEISLNMPVAGLRQPQLSVLAWGQKNIASMRPPAWMTALHILSLIALNDTMSSKPRPMPDWLVATTTRYPACVRCAIASRLPGIGFHSSGVLINAALS